MPDRPDAPHTGPPAVNACGSRQTHAYGHRVKGAPKPSSIAALIDAKNSARRAVRALTGFNVKLEAAAAFCSKVKMTEPEAAVRHARDDFFHGIYRDLPLCEIERDMAQSLNAVLLLVAYAGAARAIERQLTANRRRAAEAEATAASREADINAVLRFDEFERGEIGAEAFAHGVVVHCRNTFGRNDPRAQAFLDAMAEHAASITARERSSGRRTVS